MLVALLVCVWKVPGSVLAKERGYTGRNYKRDFRLSPRSRKALFWVITQQAVVSPSRRFGTTYRSHLQRDFVFFILEDWTDRLSRNVGKELPPLAA